MNRIICPFCGNEPEWVENSEVYGKRYGKSYMMYLCRPCDAYVGCHQNTRAPLGTMANKETRQWRIKAHEAFDPLWKNGDMSRKQAYAVIAKALHKDEFHIGSSSIEDCKEIIAAVNLSFALLATSDGGVGVPIDISDLPF